MEKIYTQADLDNMMAKAKENMKEKFLKHFVSKEEFTKLESENKTLLMENSKNAIKSEFLKRNGKEELFEDFFNISKDKLIGVKSEEMNNVLETLSTEKKWAFNDKEQLQKNEGLNGYKFGFDNLDEQKAYKAKDPYFSNQQDGQEVELEPGTMYAKIK